MPLQTDTSLVSQVQASHVEYVRGRMEAVRQVTGDPKSVRYYEAENLQACMAPGSPNRLFNQIFLSGPADSKDLARMLDLFDRTGALPRLEISPGAICTELAVQLTERGFLHTHSDPILIQTERATAVRVGAEIQVTRVESAAAFDCFVATYLQALQVAPERMQLQRRYMEHWRSIPGWTLYVARKADVAMGIGVLFSKGDVAYLAEGATIPKFRGRGAQTALISERLAETRENSYRLVFSRAQFGSTSQRNLERAGLESRYTLAIWSNEDRSPKHEMADARRNTL